MIQREKDIEMELEKDNIESTKIIKELDKDLHDSSNHYLICGDFLKDETVKFFKDKNIIVDLIFTSPPYNVGLKYDVHNDVMEIDDYLLLLEKFLINSNKLLADGGRLIINIRDIKIGSGSRYPPIVLFFNKLCSEFGYKYRGVHIWYKGREESSTAWGSWRNCSNPSIIDLFEYVYVFQKGEKIRKNDSIIKEEFIECDLGVWKIRPVKKIYGKNKNNIAGHPCPFPIELAERIIKLYSYPGETVLDPFGGIGSTSVAAFENGRNSVSIDLSSLYTELARTKLTGIGAKPLSIYI